HPCLEGTPRRHSRCLRILGAYREIQGRRERQCRLRLLDGDHLGGRDVLPDREQSVGALCLPDVRIPRPSTGNRNSSGSDPEPRLFADAASPVARELQLQLGVVGYNQWQTTDKTGPTITPAQARAHYRVNALGVAANMVLPVRNVS